MYGNGGDLTGWLLDLDLFLPAGLNVLDDKNTFFFQSVVTSVVAKAFTGMCVVDRANFERVSNSCDHPQRYEYNRCMVSDALISFLEPNVSRKLLYR